MLRAATVLRDALAAVGEMGVDDRRAAEMAYRYAIDAAVAAAAAEANALTAEDMRTRMRTNLLAAGVDEDLALRLQRGTLPDDQEAPGFGGTPTIGPIARSVLPGPRPRSGRPCRRPVPSSDEHGSLEPRGRPQRAAENRARVREPGLLRPNRGSRRGPGPPAGPGRRPPEPRSRSTSSSDGESPGNGPKPQARESERLEKQAWTRLRDQAEGGRGACAATAREAADRATEAAAEVADRLPRL